MRAYEIRDGFGLDHLVPVSRPTPEPGPGELRVALTAASLNYRDILMVQGKYNPRQPLPLIPLSDGAGVIDAVGPGVSDALVGTRVLGCFAPYWTAGEPTRDTIRRTLGGPLDGMLADAVCLPATGVVPTPSHLSDVEGATLPCAALTAWNAVVTLGGVRAGDTVLVQGTGGVASFAFDFARMHGAEVIATTGAQTKLGQLTARGAAHVVNYRSDPDWGKAVRRLTGGRGVDLVIEVGGAGTLEQSLRAVRTGGTVAMIGVLAGGRAPVNMTPVLMGQVRIQGVLVGHRESFLAMNRAIAHHGYRPPVDSVFPFEDALQAFERLRGGAHVGKIALCHTPAT